MGLCLARPCTERARECGLTACTLHLREWTTSPTFLASVLEIESASSYGLVPLCSGPPAFCAGVLE